MSDEHYGVSRWNRESGYQSWTPYGEVKMFDPGGQRAVELFLLSAAGCLNFYLVEYTRSRELPITNIYVRCDGEVVKGPERVGKLTTHVHIEGELTEKERAKMITMCERACKVMNTLKADPEIELIVAAGPAPASDQPPNAGKSKGGRRRSASAPAPSPAKRA